MLKTNDEIFNHLEFLEEYAHVTPDKAFQIVQSIVDSKKPLKAKVSRLKGFGKFYGKSHEDLLSQSIKILSKIRYLETKKVIKLLERLYKVGNPSISSEALKTFEQLSQFNLFVLRQIDYKTQRLVLQEIEKWGDERTVENLEIISTIAKELLTPIFEGHSMSDYKTLTLHSGPLVVTEELNDIRQRTISLLKKAYLLANNLAKKTKVLQILRIATEPPHSHQYSNDMVQMIVNNTKMIIDFYLEILPVAENEIIQDIEEQKIWFTRRFKNELAQKIDELEEAIRSHVGYDMFKIFVGYDGRLNPDFDYEKDRETRARKVQEFISDISDDNFEEWRKKILLVVKNYAITEPGSYSYFESFLTELGKQKPSLAIKLVKENETELAPFLINLLSGIWQSDANEQAKSIINDFIDTNKYLHIWAFIFVVVDEIDEKLFKKIFSKAKESKDSRALNNLLRSILHNYPKDKTLKSVFLETVKELTKNKNVSWVGNLWFKGDIIFSDFTNAEFDIILTALLLLPNIDYQAEEVLKPIAEKYPEKIIEFFHTRVEIKSKKKRDVDDRYDGVPFNFHQLGAVMKQHEEIIVPLLLTWYADGGKKHNWLFCWEASHLFEEIFPGFSPILEQALINLIKKGTKNSRGIVFSVLGKYKGNSFLWGVVKSLIKQYAGTKEYEEVRGHLFGYLSQMGVVSGEDGFVRGYEKKKQEVQKFKKDSDKHVREFVKDYEDYLEKQISYERKRTDEQIELMKRGL